jgi:hypothetical protein
MSATVRTVLGISNLAAPRPALEIVNAECFRARAWESNALRAARPERTVADILNLPASACRRGED